VVIATGEGEGGGEGKKDTICGSGERSRDRARQNVAPRSQWSAFHKQFLKNRKKKKREQKSVLKSPIDDALKSLSTTFYFISFRKKIYFKMAASKETLTALSPSFFLSRHVEAYRVRQPGQCAGLPNPSRGGQAQLPL